jgi:hypothetical protein
MGASEFLGLTLRNGHFFVTEVFDFKGPIPAYLNLFSRELNQEIIYPSRSQPSLQ